VNGVEYAVASGVLVSALLVPIGDPPRSAVDRLTEAVQQEQGGFLFVAGLPSLPRSDALAQGLHGASGHSGSGTSGVGTGVADTDPGYGGPEQGGGNIPGTPEDAGGASGESEGGGGEPASGDDGAGDDASLDDQGGGGDEDGATDAGSEAAEDPDSDVSDGTDHGGPQYCSLPAPSAAAVGGVPLQAVGALQISALPATHVGNPIHVLTGNKYQRETDVMSGRGEPLFERHYNSRSDFSGVTGRGWRHSYEVTLRDQGRRISIWQGDGRRVVFSTVFEEGDVRHLHANLHEDGQLSAGPWGYEWRWRDGTVLTFSKAGRLQGLRYPDRQWVELLRDARFRVVEVRIASGWALRLQYDEAGRLRQVESPVMPPVRYHYDMQARLRRVSYADQRVREYDYDDPHDAFNLTSVREIRGGRVQALGRWRYDIQDRAIASMPMQLDAWVWLKFDASGTEVRRLDGTRSRYRRGRSAGVPVVSAIEGAGCTPCTEAGNQRFAYNAKGQVIRVEHEDGRRIRYTYDHRGRLSSMVDATVAAELRSILQLTYHGSGARVDTATFPSIKPGSERSMRVRYDTALRPISVDEAGFSPLPDGGFVAIARHRRLPPQAAVRSVPEQTASLQPVRLQRGANGAVESIRYADGARLDIQRRDGQGRPARIAFDERRPIDLHYDEAGRIAAFGRGSRRLQLDRLPSGSPPSVPTLVAGEEGPVPHRFSVTDRVGHITQYGVDDFGRIAYERSGDAGFTQYQYGNDGRLTAKSQVGGRVDFHYNERGKIRQIDWGATQADFSWASGDADAHVTSIRQPGLTSRFRYDEDGRLIEQYQEMERHVFRNRIRYDDLGRLQEKHLPSGRHLRYRYHESGIDRGTLARIDVRTPWGAWRPLVTDISGMASARDQRQWRAANGLRTMLAGREGRLRRLKIDRHHDFAFVYDRQGRLTGIDDHGTPWARYRFDHRGWIDFALTPQHLFGYRYDANGNRLQRVLDGAVEHYAPYLASNRLQSYQRPLAWRTPLQFEVTDSGQANVHRRIEVRHAADGSARRWGSLRFDRNANGQIASVREGRRLRARYAYDTQARRIYKQVFDERGNRAAERFYLYEGKQLIAEADGSGAVRVEYIYLGHHPVAMLVDGEQFAVHSNHLGAPIAVTDLNGRRVWEAWYSPFGRAQVNRDPDGDGRAFQLSLRLPGQYEDVETGLHYNHHRYYDPDAGRYLSPDPLGLLAGMNPYRYADNDPVNHIDPTGLILFAFDGTGNSDPPGKNKDITNVVRFRDSYRDSQSVGSPYRYINGPDTSTPWEMEGQSSLSDGITGESMPHRVAHMAEQFFHYIDVLSRRKAHGFEFDVDVVGFSRGAAASRIFVNLLHHFLAAEGGSFLHDSFALEIRDPDRGTGYHHIDFRRGYAKRAREHLSTYCFNPNLRFLGLFDTVPHYSPGDVRGDISGLSQHDDLRQLDLTIPWSIQAVAHAVAVNENRRDFHGVSIHHRYDSSLNTERRMELGFIGAHSDIGGGYGEGDLSDVAFMWMVQRAERAGVNIDRSHISHDDQQWHVVTQPVLHDSVGVSPGYAPDNFAFRPGRNLKFLNGADEVPQQEWLGFGMPYQATFAYHDHRYLVDEWCFSDCQEYAKIDGKWKANDQAGERTMVGAVDGVRYGAFLRDVYGLDIEIKTPNRD
jgi:RHS repeat-associated protein